MSNNIPHAIYFYMQKKYEQHANHGILPYSEAVSFLHHYKIPKELRKYVINDMEKMGLVKHVTVNKEHFLQLINLKKNKLTIDIEPSNRLVKKCRIM